MLLFRMADILESEIASTDEISIEEIQVDSKPNFIGEVKNFIFHGKYKKAARSETYLKNWCVTDSNENTNETVEDREEMGEVGDSKDEKEEVENSQSEPDVEEGKLEEDKDKNSESNDEEPNVNSYFNIQPLPTLEELATSDYLHNRQLAARKILESLQQAGSNEKELQSVISVMCKLSEDEEPMVQFELMQHIPSIASYCQSEPHLRIVIRQQLMPYTVKLLNDIQVMIRRSGQSALLVLLEKNLIDQSQLIEWICPLIAQLVMCENNLEELRVEDVSLMSKMVPLVGRETTMKFFLDPFVSLCCDPAFGIRKICALGFGVLCNVVGVETTELSLLPAFLNLCNDEMWGVRKACANVFVDVAKSVTPKTRREVLPYIFVNLLTDKSRYVQLGAYQNLGAFIYTFADPKQTGCSFEDGKIIVNDTSQNFEIVNGNNVAEMQGSNSDTSETSADIFETMRVGHEHRQAKRKLRYKSYSKQPYKFDNKSASPDRVSSLYMDTSRLSQSRQKPESSLTVASKDRHVYLHVDNETSFNNFQFWRVPLPEVELDIDIEDGKATNIHVRATIQGNENVAPSSEIKVRIGPDKSSDSEDTNVSKTPGVKKMLVQTACINTLSSQEQRCLLDDDTEVLWSSFKEAVLTFKVDESEQELESTNTSVSNVEQRSVTPEMKKKDVSILTPFEQDIVPPVLLFSFISVVNESYELDKSCEDDKIGYVAYSFPAVAFTLGRKYWPCIKKACEKLARNMKWTVRRTVASSLHELATILGYEIIMADLLPIFLDLFKDVDEVRLRLVQHLSDFLKHLSPQDRKQFLPLIEEFYEVDNDKNWRFRCAVAEQLRKTAELYDAVEIPEYFLPVALTLLHDKVSAVRLEAVELIAVLLKQMHYDHRTTANYETTLVGLDDLYRHSSKWVWRQTYIKLCEQIVLKESMCMAEFVEKVLPNLFSLAWDKVPNVRLALIRCIALTLLPMNLLPSIESSPSYELLEKVLVSLTFDDDKDVRHWISNTYISDLLDEKEQSSPLKRRVQKTGI